MGGQKFNVGKKHGHHVDKRHFRRRNAHIGGVWGQHGFQQRLGDKLCHDVFGGFQGILKIQGIFFPAGFRVPEIKNTDDLEEKVIQQVEKTPDALFFMGKMLREFGNHLGKIRF